MKYTISRIPMMLLLMVLMHTVLCSQEFKAKIDFKNIKDDKAHVTLFTPKMDTDEILYIMPASIPGTYARMDFGYFGSGRGGCHCRANFKFGVRAQ